MTDVEIVVHGRHVDVSNRFREQVTDKLARVDRFGIQINRVDVELSKENNPRLADRAFQVELTCRNAGPVIRAEACSADKYSALDLAIDKLEEQLRRAHDRHKHHYRNTKGKNNGAASAAPASSNGHKATAIVDEVELEDLTDDEVFALGPVVVRTKVHDTAPMSVEEAVTQMELVDHDFFLFQEIETNTPAVVYRRRGFNYGLIRIETAVAVGES